MIPSTTGDSVAVAPLGCAPSAQEMADFAALLTDIGRVAGQIDLNTSVTSAPGVDARAISIPAGTYLAGLPHNLGAINVVSGDITVWQQGSSRRYTGLCVVASAPTGGRIGYAHTDTVWISCAGNPNDSVGAQREQELTDHPEMLKEHAGPSIGCTEAYPQWLLGRKQTHRFWSDAGVVERLRDSRAFVDALPGGLSSLFEPPRNLREPILDIDTWQGGV
jgi:hypothetical protein